MLPPPLPLPPPPSSSFPTSKARDSYPSISTQTLQSFTPPQINTIVVYGYGTPTPQQLIFNEDFIKGGLEGPVPKVTKFVNGDGDGTVSVGSATRGEVAWGKGGSRSGSGSSSSSSGGSKGWSLKSIGIENGTHIGLVFDRQVFEIVKEVVVVVEGKEEGTMMTTMM